MSISSKKGFGLEKKSSIKPNKMVEKIIRFNNKELSFKALVAKKRTFKQKAFFLLILIYILLIPIAMSFTSLNTPYNFISLALIGFFLLDVVLFIKKSKGVLSWYLKKSDQLNLQTLNVYKKKYKIDFNNISEGLFQVRKIKLEFFFKKYKLEKDYDFILSSLRHKENFELAIVVIVFSAVMIAITTFSINLIEFYSPIENLKEIKDQIKSVKGTELEKKNLYSKMTYLVLLIFSIISLVQILPYLFAKGFFEMKFYRLKNLQALIENMHLSKK